MFHDNEQNELGMSRRLVRIMLMIALQVILKLFLLKKVLLVLEEVVRFNPEV